jgi:hypothetical protein
MLLAADHPEDADRYSPMVSRLLHLVIIDILTTGVALRLGSATLRPMLQEIKKNLRLRRYTVARPRRGPAAAALPRRRAAPVRPAWAGAPVTCRGTPRRGAPGPRRLQQQRDGEVS